MKEVTKHKNVKLMYINVIGHLKNPGFIERLFEFKFDREGNLIKSLQRIDDFKKDEKAFLYLGTYLSFFEKLSIETLETFKKSVDELVKNKPRDIHYISNSLIHINGKECPEIGSVYSNMNDNGFNFRYNFEYY